MVMKTSRVSTSVVKYLTFISISAIVSINKTYFSMSNVFAQMWEQKWSFFAVFFAVISVTYLILLAIDVYPEPRTEQPAAEESADSANENMLASSNASVESLPPVAPSATAVQSGVSDVLPESTLKNSESAELAHVDESDAAVLPVRMRIDRLDREMTILNPRSRLIADLDAALLGGAVRHPDSANLAQDGNVFILGHSSYLPNVFNRNFQILNGIQDLEWGDVITVYSETHVYEYRVERVYRARAQDVTVPIAGTGKRLTIATCNSFGSVDDRYIVESKQVSVRPLSA